MRNKSHIFSAERLLRTHNYYSFNVERLLCRTFCTIFTNERICVCTKVRNQRNEWPLSDTEPIRQRIFGICWDTNAAQQKNYSLCVTQKDEIRENMPFVYAQNNKIDGIIPFVGTQKLLTKKFSSKWWIQCPFRWKISYSSKCRRTRSYYNSLILLIPEYLTSSRPHAAARILSCGTALVEAPGYSLKVHKVKSWKS